MSLRLVVSNGVERANGSRLISVESKHFLIGPETVLVLVDSSGISWALDRSGRWRPCPGASPRLPSDLRGWALAAVVLFINLVVWKELLR